MKCWWPLNMAARIPLCAGRIVEWQRQAAWNQQPMARTMCARSRSRSGHVIRLTDKQGDEKIEIVDKSDKNSIVISTKDNTITITPMPMWRFNPPKASSS